jgi:putative component of toxin-antitoxin plasmid stabilization module
VRDYYEPAKRWRASPLRDGELVVVLCGGYKDSQSKDVRRAKALKEGD